MHKPQMSDLLRQALTLAKRSLSPSDKRWALTGLSLPLVILAVLPIVEGVWQRSGLHGYVLQPGAKGGSPHIVSVWISFVQALTLMGAAVLSGGIFWWGNQRNQNYETTPCPTIQQAHETYRAHRTRRGR